MGLGYSKFEAELTDDFIESIKIGDHIEETLQVIRRHPFVINNVNREGELALSVALDMGKAELVNEILKCESFRPDMKSETDGSTYIMRACQASEQHQSLAEDVVRAILSMKPKVLDEKDTENGWTALHYCAANDSADIAELLLSRNKDFLTRAVDHYGSTALHVASERGSYAICKLLLSGNYYEYTSEPGSEVLPSSEHRNREYNRAIDLAASRDITELFEAHINRSFPA